MPKKPKILPPRGEKGRFVKEGPRYVDAPSYSPMRVGLDVIDWQREFKREVLPPRRHRPPREGPRTPVLGWAVVFAGLGSLGYMATRLKPGPSWGR